MLKIKSIKRQGNLDFRRLTLQDHSKTRREFLEKYGVTLPTADELELHCDLDLRLLLEPVTLWITLKDGSTLRYSFRTGFIYDTASVPKFMRGIVDNDDLRLLLAAMVHDANFRCHWLKFTTVNRLFRKMIIEAGGSRWLAFKAWLAVASPVGYVIFRRFRKSEKVVEARRWCGFRVIK